MTADVWFPPRLCENSIARARCARSRREAAGVGKSDTQQPCTKQHSCWLPLRHGDFTQSAPEADICRTRKLPLRVPLASRMGDLLRMSGGGRPRSPARRPAEGWPASTRPWRGAHDPENAATSAATAKHLRRAVIRPPGPDARTRSRDGGAEEEAWPASWGSRSAWTPCHAGGSRRGRPPRYPPRPFLSGPTVAGGAPSSGAASRPPARGSFPRGARRNGAPFVPDTPGRTGLCPPERRASAAGLPGVEAGVLGAGRPPRPSFSARRVAGFDPLAPLGSSGRSFRNCCLKNELKRG